MKFYKDKKILNKETKMEIESGPLKGSIIISCIILLIVVICFLWKREFSLSTTIESDVFGQFGDFVGGVIGTVLTLLSIMLLYYTFVLTKQQIKSQQRQQEKTQVEARFFELLKIHRENAEKIKEENKGFSVFKKYVDEINKNYGCIKIYESQKESSISLNDVISISYLIFFYGVKTPEGLNTIKEVLLQNKSNIDIKFIDGFSKEEKKTLSGGHEIELGHYFRHLYQIVKYINERNIDILSYKERYDYIKILRAQLTTYEQIILFWDSLSPLGMSWEFRERNKQKPDKNKQLITKYNLIKNIPAKFADGDVKPNIFYPEVNFDWIETPSDRNESIYF